MSPLRYMREKARTLPVGKCYICPPDWQEHGIAHIIVTRVRPSGNIVMALFLVDTYCLGVKAAAYYVNLTPGSFEKHLDYFRREKGVKEISYEEAHNIIYGAIEFAEEAGIEPPKEFDIAGYILEEDTDDVPLIEYEFGKNGKHLLIVSPHRKEMPYLDVLRKNLGVGNFDFIFPYEAKDNNDDDVEDDYFEDDIDDNIDPDNDDKLSSMLKNLSVDDIKRALDNIKKMNEESSRHPAEVYSYKNPEYPDAPIVKNQFIDDELFSPENFSEQPRDVIDRILALPADEAADDLGNLILYEIGRTYESIDDDTIGVVDNNAIMHALILLAQIESDKGLDAVLELMRQTDRFADYHLGDLAPDLLRTALYASGRNNVHAIEDYIRQPGLDSYLRSQATAALVMITKNHPERRAEIIEVFRQLLNSMVTRLPKQEACDGYFAGSLMYSLVDLEAKELIPEIEAVFTTDCVDKTVTGDCKKVVESINNGEGAIMPEKYEIPDIYEQYACYRNFLKKPE